MFSRLLHACEIPQCALKAYLMANTTKNKIFKSTLLASFGLFLFGFGVYLTIQANIGVGPWDAFNLGLSKTFNIKYGTASITVSLIILAIDICLKEKIGIGMLLDAFIVGKTVDLFNAINLVPAQTSFLSSLIVINVGMIIMGFSQFLYMKAGLGCGPRDTLLVGLKRKIAKVPIGAISICLLTIVTAIGYLLGGPIGIGTLLSAALEGYYMQWAFKIVHFDPTKICHQSLLESWRILVGAKTSN